MLETGPKIMLNPLREPCPLASPFPDQLINLQALPEVPQNSPKCIAVVRKKKPGWLQKQSAKTPQNSVAATVRIHVVLAPPISACRAG